tara:strand:- start:6585 stop:7052 length:468 start_codon:yes stop_codon:yes gene_type:complete
MCNIILLKQYYTNRQIKEFKQRFKLQDKLKLGYIFVYQIESIIYDLESKSLDSYDMIIIIKDFYRYDKVTLNNFLHILISAAQNKEKNIILCRNTFNHFDLKKDGYLCANELRFAMNSLGVNMNKKEAEEMVTIADSDGDGLVSFEDFVMMMREF